MSPEGWTSDAGGSGVWSGPLGSGSLTAATLAGPRASALGLLMPTDCWMGTAHWRDGARSLACGNESRTAETHQIPRRASVTGDSPKGGEEQAPTRGASNGRKEGDRGQCLS